MSISEKLEIPIEYADGAREIEKSDGTKKIELHLNNFWLRFSGDNKIELTWFLSKGGNRNPDDKNLWEKFKREHNELYLELVKFSDEKNHITEEVTEPIDLSLSKEEINRILKEREEKIKEFREKTQEKYEEAYIILARMGVSRMGLRG